MTDSEETDRESEIEFIRQSAKDLEQIAVDLYNNQDFSTAERLCSSILRLYEKINSEEDVKRIKVILLKLSLVDQYFDATFGLLKKQIDEKRELESESK
ncbi:MAG: hypothetical protein JW776_10365 [Candidatus Lokiarchaeota archaeon]|nr:hypothetical protein [Candidatus Lokiarchaeota archaeon]